MDTTKVIALPTLTAYATLTTPGVSEKIYIGSYKKIGICLKRTNHASGNSAFTIQASMEEKDTVTPTMVAYNMAVKNLTNSNAEHETRVNGLTLAADGSDFLWINNDYHINWLQITAVNTTDGKATAFLLVQIEE